MVAPKIDLALKPLGRGEKQLSSNNNNAILPRITVEGKAFGDGE
jgi:hypothetical protein